MILTRGVDMREHRTWLDKGTDKILKKPEYANKNFKMVKNALPQKMSEILLDFAAPFLESIDMSNRIALKSAVKMAVFIWNYSIIDSGCQPKNIDDSTVNSVKQLVKKQLYNDPIGRVVITTLLERKKVLYPDNNRMIMDFDVSWDKTGENVHLTILSPD